MLRLGVDVGGTFTDVVAVRGGEAPRIFKTPSTPRDPSVAVLRGLEMAAGSYGLPVAELCAEAGLLIHGTTVATNTLIEGKGARVGLVTTEGFRDILETREGFKEDRYNLRMEPLAPLVPRRMRMAVPERVRCDGSVEAALDEDALRSALDDLEREGAEAIAVCFLFSFANPDHERAAAEMVRARLPGAFLSLSSEVLPQIKEFDRVSTTAVNSYVGPVYSEYLTRLDRRLAELSPGGAAAGGGVLIMQSSGGVMPLEDSRLFPVRAILSGPAGGVGGAARCGALAGESRVVALDMGGTSTDISLVIDGAAATTTETFEAGWKIAVPMLDVSTLGAGGGSIASVDTAGLLRVGPQSAGADPGPACYGRGGTDATLTDAAVALGHLGPDRFLGGRQGLRADKAVRAIGTHVAGPLGLSVEAAADGVREVVSTTVAEGIRLRAARSGVDPRSFALVAFGGAAGLVAASVARRLGIERVIVPAEAPVLSAWGMLGADLRYDLSISHPADLGPDALGGIRKALSDLAGRARALLGSRDGLSGADVVLSADMRYADQMYEVSVPVPDLGLGDAQLLAAWREALHRRYEELYSYSQRGLDIRLVTLRAAAVGRLPDLGPGAPAQGAATPRAPGRRRAYLGGRWVDAAVFDLAGGLPETGVRGPAILESDLCTVVLEEGDEALPDGRGGAVVAAAAMRRTSGAGGATDPVTTAVVERRLDSIALEMMEVMLRTSLSQIVNASRDFSTALLDARGRLVAQGEGIPVHISALPLAARAVLESFAGDMGEGDVFILNDPYHGGSHLPDVTVLRPVFSGGELSYMAVNRAHHSDIGGGTHGGYNPAATEIFHEGLRLPPMRIVDRGSPRGDVLRMMAANTRYPEGFLGDLSAQMGSVEIAADRIRALLCDYGPDLLGATVEGLMDAAEAQVRAFVSGWPDGTYLGESILDDDGHGSRAIPIRAAVTVSGDELTIDLSGSSPQVTGFVNSVYANTRSIVHATVMYLAPADLPKNEGSMRPVKVIAPEGLIVNAAAPAPVTMSTNHVAEEIAEAIFLALAPAVPHAVSAGFGRRLRYAITGTDPRTGARFLWHFFLGRPGGGASLEHDGWSNVGELNSVGAIRAPSIEVTEERFPLFVLRNELRPDSGGRGRRRGGLGSVCEIVYEGEGDAVLNTAGDGIVNPPPGILGGSPGLPHRYSIVSDGRETELRSKQTGVRVRPGDSIRVLSAGGGGAGDPARRERGRTESDLREGYVTT